MKKTFVLLILRLSASALAYLINAIITNSTTTKEAGYYFLFSTVITLFSGVTKLGFDIDSIRVVSVNYARENFDFIKEYILEVTVLLLLVNCLFSIPLSITLYYSINDSGVILLGIISLITFCLKDIFASYLRGLNSYFQASFVLNIGFPLFFVFCLEIIKLFHTSYNLYLVFALSSVLVFLVGLFFLKTNNVISKITYFNLSRLGTASKKVSLQKYQVSLLMILLTWLPNILIGFSLNVENVAVFNVISRTAILISFIYIAVENYISPKIAAYWSNGELKLIESLLVRMSKMSFVVSSAVLIGTIIFSKEILGFFGEQYSSYYLLLDILAFAQYVNVLTGSAATYLLMSGDEKIVRNVYLSALLILIVLVLLTARIAGLFWVVISYSLVIMFYNILLAIIVKQRDKIRATFLIP